VDDVAQVSAADVVVGAEIARGGFGTVFEAKWRGMTVAAKQLKVRPHERVALFGDFRKEVRFMSRLRHPNIVALLGFCAEPPMLLLELLTGGDLYSFLHDSSRELDWRLRVRIWRDVARGLAYLHGTTPATLHLDLKSPNVLMVGADDDTDNVAKVSDFGTSVRAFGAVREDSARRTVSNPTWLAPEVLAGKPHAESSDVYALGVIGWELLTREHPFAHLNSSFVFELEDAIRAGKRPPLPASAPRRFVRWCAPCGSRRRRSGRPPSASPPRSTRSASARSTTRPAGPTRRLVAPTATTTRRRRRQRCQTTASRPSTRRRAMARWRRSFCASAWSTRRRRSRAWRRCRAAARCGPAPSRAA
jgi:serine/threonine protein kinase